jgi:hypothetical protein
MTSIITSISLPKKLFEWLESKKEGKSFIIGGLIFDAKQKETLEFPKLIKEELNEIDEKMEKNHIRKKILINRLSTHLEKTKITNDIDKQKSMEYIKQVKKEEKEKVKLVQKIPKIDVILKKAFVDPSKFDYFNAVDKVRKNDGFEKIGVVDLKLYVESKGEK